MSEQQEINSEYEVSKDQLAKFADQLGQLGEGKLPTPKAPLKRDTSMGQEISEEDKKETKDNPSQPEEENLEQLDYLRKDQEESDEEGSELGDQSDNENDDYEDAVTNEQEKREVLQSKTDHDVRRNSPSRKGPTQSWADQAEGARNEHLAPEHRGEKVEELGAHCNRDERDTDIHPVSKDHFLNYSKSEMKRELEILNSPTLNPIHDRQLESVTGSSDLDGVKSLPEEFKDFAVKVEGLADKSMPAKAQGMFGNPSDFTAGSNIASNEFVHKQLADHQADIIQLKNQIFSLVRDLKVANGEISGLKAKCTSLQLSNTELTTRMTEFDKHTLNVMDQAQKIIKGAQSPTPSIAGKIQEEITLASSSIAKQAAAPQPKQVRSSKQRKKGFMF